MRLLKGITEGLIAFTLSVAFSALVISAANSLPLRV
jgi:hypothetical protein